MSQMVKMFFMALGMAYSGRPITELSSRVKRGFIENFK